MEKGVLYIEKPNGEKEIIKKAKVGTAKLNPEGKKILRKGMVLYAKKISESGFLPDQMDLGKVRCLKN